MRTVAAIKLNSQLKDLHIPTLFIAAKDDLIVPYENTIATKEIIPNAQLVSFEGAGHFDLIKWSDQYVGLSNEYGAAINKFLSQ